MGITVSKIPSFTGNIEKLDQELKKVLDRQGKLLVQEARKRVPVKTGRLQRSIEYTVDFIRYGRRLLFGVGVDGGDNPPYADIQEQKTRYIQGAYEARKRELSNAIENAVKKAFK